MKALKIIISSIFCFFLVSNGLQAQSNAVKIAAINSNSYTLAYERAWTPIFSTSIGYLSKNSEYRRGDDYTNRAKGINFEGRVYLNKRNRGMTGLYIAPSLAFQRQQLSYYDDPNPSGFGVFGSLLLSILTGDFDSNNGSSPEQLPTVSGKETINSTSMGLKIGLQRYLGRFNYDIGINFQRNRVNKNHKGIPVSDGTFLPYEKDVNGKDIQFHLGIGFTF